MFIKDKSSNLDFFGKLEGGAIFGCGGGFYCKLCEEVHCEPVVSDTFNAVNLYDGDVCRFDDREVVENLAGHTLEIADGMEGRT